MSRHVVNERDENVRVSVERYSPASMNIPPPYPPGTQDVNEREMSERDVCDDRVSVSAPPHPFDDT